MGDEEEPVAPDPLEEIASRYEPLFQEKLAIRKGIESQLEGLGAEYEMKLGLLTPKLSGADQLQACKDIDQLQATMMVQRDVSNARVP